MKQTIIVTKSHNNLEDASKELFRNLALFEKTHDLPPGGSEIQSFQPVCTEDGFFAMTALIKFTPEIGA